MESLHCEVDGRAAEPLAASLDRVGNLVTAIVPPGYERYIRVLNPLELNDGSLTSWSRVAVRNGLEASPWMQWDELKAHVDAPLYADDAEPEMGQPHPSLARALIRELRVDPGRHYFASWTGYAEESRQPVIEFSPSDREMLVYSGALIDDEGFAIVPTTAAGRVPMYWWPEDLRWCVGQDLYARSLIVACDLPTAGRILAAPDLDSYLIRETDMVRLEDF